MNRRRLFAGGVAGLVAILVWAIVRQPLAEAVVDGLRMPWLNTTVRTFGADPLELVDRAFWLTWVLCGIAVVLLARYPRPVRRLLLARGHALDLAVTRVVVFGVLALLPRVREAVAVSSASPDLRRPPAGVPWLLDVIPPSPGLMRVLAVTFVVACLAACVGAFTRPAAVTAVILGFYVLGVPQFYGKVSHYHHLLWIAAVLAAAPSGAALSVDAMRRAWRRGVPGRAGRRRAVEYGFPLRIIWLLIAITYLFPGMWKFVSAGFAWALSDNMQTVMYEHWTRLEGFVPVVRVDQWPIAYRAGGLFTLLFELGFVFLIWAPRTRYFAAAAGLVFHNINFLVLRLSFATLQACYVAFVPWQRLAHRVGARLRPVEVRVADGRGRRLLAALAVLDVFARIRLHRGDGLPEVSAFGRQETGWPAVRLAVRAMPLAWPLLPFLWAVPTRRGDAWLNADAQAPTADPAPPPARGRVPRAVAVVGGVLILGNTYAGLGAVSAAWPFAVYPTFAGQAVLSPEILFVITPTDGAPVEITASELRQSFTWEKLDGLSKPILQESSDAELRARALLATAAEEGIPVPPGGNVEVYASKPEWTPEGVRSAGRRLVLEFAL